MNRIILYICFVFTLSLSIDVCCQTAFTAGNIVVARVGDGSSALGTTAVPVFLDEFTPSGFLVRSIALPTVSSGTNKALVVNGTGSTIANLSLSEDKKFLSIVGFNSPLGTSVTTMNGSSTNRTIAVIKYDGTVNSEISLTDAGTSTPFSAVSNNGIEFWCTFSSSGLRYVNIGTSTTTSTSLIAAAGSYRISNIFSGQLYVSGSSGSIRSVGTGLPTSTSPSTTALPGIPSSGGSAYQFLMFDLNSGIPGNDVLYVANENSRGLQKYSYDGTNWLDNGIVGGDADDYRFITGYSSGATVTLFGTRFGSVLNANGGYGEIVSIVDGSGHNGIITVTPTTIVTAAVNTAYRGIAMAPTNSTLPIKLLSFSATKSMRDALLDWSTSSETDFSHFELEKSYDALHFAKIASVNAKPEASANKLYNCIDANAFTNAASMINYRLKMVDKDGKFTYSSVVTLKNDSRFVELVTAYPNPVDKELFLKVTLHQAAKATITITDIAGRRVGNTIQLNIPAGSNTISAPGIQSLSTGNYILIVEANGNVNSIKLVKQ